MDESGTINPAALNAPASTIAPNLLTQPSPRGTKRSRAAAAAEEEDQHLTLGQGDDVKTNKRSRLSDLGDLAVSHQMLAPVAPPVQTPRIRPESLPQSSPTHASPQRTPSSASRPAVVKALPTVRDHTTDQLNEERDEYVYREIDPEGETKVSKDGYPMDSRKFKCRTFQVPNRGEKLFMLATECARVLGYRDSYLLFNKNRSLHKIIANQPEKDNLIHQEILPYSYRSRQIAIVTARSMFRQFGSRLIEGGRRVRDDYWEAKARKQGFTEEDAAGEKRPGAAKAREQAAAEASSSANALTALPQSEIIYSTNGLDRQPPGLAPQPNLAPLPMIHLPSDDLRPAAGGYGNIIRPRQDISGAAPYQDRTQSGTAAEIMNQAGHAAEWNKQLGVTRQHRTSYLNDYWRRPHEQPVQPTTAAAAAAAATTQADAGGDINTVAPHNLQSPQAVATAGASRMPQDHMAHPGPQHMMPQVYSAYSNPQNPMASPVQAMHRSLPPGQMHQGSPPMPGSARQTPSFPGGYPSAQMWQASQPQPSPMSQSHGMSQYGHAQQQQHHQQQQHQQQQAQQAQQHHHHSPMAPPPQMSSAHMAAYGQMNPALANSAAAFAGLNRSMYQHPSASPQQQQQQQHQHQHQQQQQQQPQQPQFNMQSPGAGQGQGMQGWGGTQGGMPQYGQGF